MVFEIVFEPCSISRGIREMNRQIRMFEASDEMEARRMVRKACPGGFDETGEWSVASVSPVKGG